MTRTNREWLPLYCNPDALLPKIPETRALFSSPPMLIQDVIGKTISYLESDEMKKVGLVYDRRRVVPCRWKCSDEALFGVDLAIYAYTRAYPFDKGKIGGMFNPESLDAAVAHGSINVDVGGSHVGYEADEEGGSFGRIWRPATREYSTDCGHLMAVLAPFERVYRDACESILVAQPEGELALISVPNEYVQPAWSRERIKLLVNLDELTDGEVAYHPDQRHTGTMIGRSLFYLHPRFLEGVDYESARGYCTPKPRPIGRELRHRYFNIWDSDAELENGLPKDRLLLYMKFILSARHSPAALKAAVVNAALQHNQLTDTVRMGAYRDYDFVSVSGVFIDQYDHQTQSYSNLFQPMGMTIKPRGQAKQRSYTPAQIHELFKRLPVARPQLPLERIFGYPHPDHIVESFRFEPGKFTRHSGNWRGLP